MQIGPEAYRPDVAGAGFARGPGPPSGPGEHQPAIGQPQLHGSGMPAGGEPMSQRASFSPNQIGVLAMPVTPQELRDVAAQGVSVNGFGVSAEGVAQASQGTVYQAANFAGALPVAHLSELAAAPGAAATSSPGGGHVEMIDHGDGSFSTVPTYSAGHEEEPLPDWMNDDGGPPDKHYEPLGYGDV
jgi:hypothetical protein